MNPIDRRTASSSSTRCTNLSSELAIATPRWQCELEYRASVPRALAPDSAAMRLDDGPADRQADTHAGLLGRDERLEQLRRHGLADSRASVPDADRDEALRLRGARDGQRAHRAIDHRLDRVADEIQQHL